MDADQFAEELRKMADDPKREPEEPEDTWPSVDGFNSRVVIPILEEVRRNIRSDPTKAAALQGISQPQTEEERPHRITTSVDLPHGRLEVRVTVAANGFVVMRCIGVYGRQPVSDFRAEGEDEEARSWLRDSIAETLRGV